MVLVWFRKHEGVALLAAGFGVSRATSGNATSTSTRPTVAHHRHYRNRGTAST